MHTLLIVDDQPYQRYLLTRILRAEYNVITVSSGAAALSMLKSRTFDLVLLDLLMPGMGGLEVLPLIRNQPRTATLPVIVMSNRTDSPQISTAFDYGADDALVKPLDSEMVRLRVRRQIALRKRHDTQEATIKELREGQAEYRRLIRMVAHDLKHPLANLRMAEVILRRHIAPDARPVVDGMTATVDAMQETIDDYLSAFTADGKPVLQPVALDALLRDLVLQYTPAALKKQIIISPRHTDAWVTGDDHRLRQLLGNLLSNAVKYSPPDSTVRLYTEYHGEHLRVCVADQGPGIPPAERAQLFTEFGKLSTRPTGQESSTGLGLWIAKRHAEAMQGQVGADFPPGGGSVFWVELPAALVAAQAAAGA